MDNSHQKFASHALKQRNKSINKSALILNATRTTKSITSGEMKRVTDFLSNLIKLSVRATIKEQGYFSITNEHYLDDEDETADYYASDTDKFSELVEQRYQLQIISCYQDEVYGSCHNIKFEVRGKLAEVFSKFDIEPTFEAWYSNYDGEPEQTFLDLNEFSVNLRFTYYQGLRDKEFDDFELFYDEMTKLFLFDLLTLC